jgi:two-component system sensor histidine kinase VicK
VGAGLMLMSDEVFSRNRFSQKVVIKGLGDTGIGLPIAKAIIEAHGGHMWLITHEGIGTRFNVALPINRVKFD